MKDIGWLDIRRIRGDGKEVISVVPIAPGADVESGQKRKRDPKDEGQEGNKST